MLKDIINIIACNVINIHKPIHTKKLTRCGNYIVIFVLTLWTY